MSYDYDYEYDYLLAIFPSLFAHPDDQVMEFFLGCVSSKPILQVNDKLLTEITFQVIVIL